MIHSSSELSELFTALCGTQDDPHTEAEPLRAVVRATRPVDRRRGRTWEQRFFASVAFGLCDCWYWTGYVDPLGYGRTGGKTLGENKAHRFAYRLFKGEIPPGLEVMHSCDVRCCVNPDHLSVGTHADNIADMVRKGRQRSPGLRGERNPQAKLTRPQVDEIRRLKDRGEITQAEIARRFGVSPMTVSRIVRGEMW